MYVPERFRQATRADLWPGSPLRQLVEGYLQAFWTNFESGIAPVFFGRGGTGKTTAAAVIARNVWEVGQVDTEFIAVPDIATEFEFARFSEATQSLVWRMKNAPFLVLDDIHVLAAPKSGAAPAIASVAAARWNARRPTLWTGNFDLPRGREWTVLYTQLGPVLGRRIEDGSVGYRGLLE